MKNLGLVCALVLMTGCGYYYEERPAPDSGLEKAGEAVTFQAVRDRVFVPYCVRCHSAYSNENTTGPDREAISAAAAAGRMPKGGPPLSSSLKDLLSRWAKGATAPAPVLIPVWASVYENIFAPRCVVCHNENGPARFLPLTSRDSLYNLRAKYLNFEKPRESLLIQVLEDDAEPMPPKDSNIRRLTQNEISALTEWIGLNLP